MARIQPDLLNFRETALEARFPTRATYDGIATTLSAFALPRPNHGNRWRPLHSLTVALPRPTPPRPSRHGPARHGPATTAIEGISTLSAATVPRPCPGPAAAAIEVLYTLSAVVSHRHGPATTTH
jgi:hypothetical protein